jgi:selenide,water dikinase
MTDVTGFGLLGHALEVARASGVGIDIDAAAVPLLPGALEYARGGVTTGGAGRNRVHIEPAIDGGDIEPAVVDVLYDPQTSGGLLIALDPAGAAAIEERARAAGLSFALIGRVRDGDGIRLK